MPKRRSQIPFCFVHAADFHLGTPLKGDVSRLPNVFHTIKEATITAFQSLIALCIRNKAIFLLVAGDVFDDAERSLGAQLIFRDGAAELDSHGIHTIVVHGNHDPEFTWTSHISWPERVHFFGSDTVSTVIQTIQGSQVAAISGISYSAKKEERRPISLFKASYPDLFQIGLLHTSCGYQPAHAVYAPCSLSELRQAGLDYWALGHVHERGIISRDPFVVYPGNIQGLNIRETGPRGCYVVSVDTIQKANLSFYPLDSIRWISVPIHMEKITSLSELERAILFHLKTGSNSTAGRPGIARIILSGRSSLYSELRKEDTVEMLLSRSREKAMLGPPPIWIQEIRIDCFPQIDLPSRRLERDLLGQILRDVNQLREKGCKSKKAGNFLPEILKPALDELYNDRRISRWLEPLEDMDCERLFDEAERICLDLLETDY